MSARSGRFCRLASAEFIGLLPSIVRANYSRIQGQSRPLEGCISLFFEVRKAIKKGRLAAKSFLGWVKWVFWGYNLLFFMGLGEKGVGGWGILRFPGGGLAGFELAGEPVEGEVGGVRGLWCDGHDGVSGWLFGLHASSVRQEGGIIRKWRRDSFQAACC
jgi:hypothetical protein